MKKEVQSKTQKTIGKLIRLNKLHRAAIESKIEELGIHTSQHLALVTVAKNEGKWNQIKVAEELGISAAAVSVTMKKLEKTGFITRRDQDEDARQKALSLTAKGRKVIDSTEKIFDEVDSEMCRNISEEDLDTLDSIITRMIANFEADGNNGAEDK